MGTPPRQSTHPTEPTTPGHTPTVELPQESTSPPRKSTPEALKSQGDRPRSTKKAKGWRHHGENKKKQSIFRGLYNVTVFMVFEPDIQ